MITVLAVFEDVIMAATRQDIQWQAEFGDALSGKSFKTELSDSEVGAILALIAGVGEDDETLAGPLYKIAEIPLANCPPECRPIP